MSPFDAARYARLLEGLEVSEVCLSELNLGDRADAEYVSKENLRVESLLKHRPHKRLGSLVDLTASAFYPAATHLYGSGGVPFLRCVDCIDYPLITKAQEEEFETIPQEFIDAHASVRTVKKGDIIITKVGSPCFASIVHEHDHLALSRTVLGAINIRGVDAYYLTAFLRSHYGFNQLLRQREQTIQFQLTLERVRDIDVFLPSESLQSRVAELMRYATAERSKASLAVEHGTAILLEALGLQGWQAPESLSYVRRSSEAFASGRLDAQHFQPRFQALTDFIDATGQGARLADWLSENQRGRQPDYAEVGLPVVNSKHVLRGEVRVDADNRCASFDEDDLLIHQGDVLLNGTGVGTIGRCAPYLHEQASIPDNHVTVLRPKSGLDAVYLSVFLNSMAGQWQVEQRLRGSSGQIELYPNDIGQFRVWVAPAAVQAKIRKAVETSHQQRQQAGLLLDAAKRAVEVAIEDSEAAALAYLDKVAPRPH